MATASIFAKKDYLSKDGTVPIYLRLTINRKVYPPINLQNRTRPSDWDAYKGRARSSHPNAFRLNQFLDQQQRRAEEDPYHILQKRYQVKGVDFGNWVPIDMRFNYLIGCIVAIHDIEKATGIKFGKKVLSLAFGARGSGRALAHFEPLTNTINITRYSRDDGRGKFIRSGGVGSLAHEYGHFLDYYFGVRVKNGSGSRALSGGHSTATRFSDEELSDRGPWGLMSNILKAIIWMGPNTQTGYYQRVLAHEFRAIGIFCRDPGSRGPSSSDRPVN